MIAAFNGHLNVLDTLVKFRGIDCWALDNVSFVVCELRLSVRLVCAGWLDGVGLGSRCRPTQLLNVSFSTRLSLQRPTVSALAIVACMN